MICLLVLIVLAIRTTTATHFITGNVFNASNGGDANGWRVYIYKVGDSANNLTDIIGLEGNSGSSNRYMIDCELSPVSCTLNDNITVIVPDNGTGYYAGPVYANVTGAGWDQAPNMTLTLINAAPNITSISVDDVTADPADKIDLTANSTRIVYCNFTVYDEN
ncbi:hypothetical protein JXA85_00870, partial [Candidatus Woesearchaeota archaeon]|nr:hypothetical protein [Candidatus Woesearchaeota archaeon]